MHSRDSNLWLNNNDVYEMPSDVCVLSLKSLTMVSICTSFYDWHKRLGFPSTSVLQHLIESSVILLSSKSSLPLFVSHVNVTRVISSLFDVSSLTSHDPLI